MAGETNLLSPEELDALSAGLSDGSIASDTGLNVEACLLYTSDAADE